MMLVQAVAALHALRDAAGNALPSEYVCSVLVRRSDGENGVQLLTVLLSLHKKRGYAVLSYLHQLFRLFF